MTREGGSSSTRALAWFTGILALLLAYGPALRRSFARSLEPLVVNDDARQQIFPLHRWVDPSAFPQDYITDYYLNAFLPLGYRALYRTATLVGDPLITSAVLPYALLVVLLAAIAFTANRIGGIVAALLAMALCLTGSTYLHSLSGGLPRAFGLPVLAIGVATLVAGRARLAMASVWLGAALYPAAGALVGMTTSAVWLLLPRLDRGDAAAWSLGRRLAMLAVTVVVSLGLLAPMILGARPYGRMLSVADVEEYPEVGRGGRFDDDDVAPWPSYWVHAREVALRSVVGHGAAWIESEGARAPGLWMPFLGVILLGWGRLLVRSAAARVVTAMLATAFLGNLLARALEPFLYLPSRYVTYPVPLVCAVAIPSGLVSACEWAAHSLGRARVGPWAAAALGGVALLLVGAHGDARLGLTRDAGRYASLLAFVETLPHESLLAGFPRGPINDVPLFARRRILMGYETHVVFHEGYTAEMRRRLRAFLAAYYATTPRPLRTLQTEFGVSHVLVDRRHFGPRSPRYFRPFGAWVEGARARNDGKPLLLSAEARRAEVWRQGWLSLVDLTRLLDGPHAQGSR